MQTGDISYIFHFLDNNFRKIIEVVIFLILWGFFTSVCEQCICPNHTVPEKC